MGQQNEIEEPKILLKQLNSFESKLKKGKILSEESFLVSINIIKEYLDYKSILDKSQKKKQTKNNKNNENYDKNKLDEISHKFDRLNKWIKMVKTPYSSNLKYLFNIIKGGESKKIANKNLYKDKSTDNIFSKGLRRQKNILNNNNIFNQENFETDKKNKNNDNNEPLLIKKLKRKKTSSLDKNKNTQKNNESENDYQILLETYCDKRIEEKILAFYLNNKSKFKERIFKGPPESFRWISWCIINGIPLERDINIYNNYLVKDLEEENKNSIIRDIQRTFTDKNIDKDELRKKETSLYNILKAFWNLDDQVGYCQGMNLLVGFMLLVSEGNELDIFYLLISNFSATFNTRKSYDYSFRGLFSEGFPLLAFLNFIFDILLEDNIPEIKNHLDELGITYDLWIGQWFQTLFTIVLPINWCKRVWDCIFSDNIYFLVKFGIVFTKMIKNEILEKTEEIDVINFFKDMQKFSMCSENKFLEQKSDINTLIIKANKIKIDPEEYIKLYKKRNENYNEFKIEMDKNSGVLFPLEFGNKAWNDFVLNNRQTKLFENEDKDEGKGISLDQIKELNAEDEKEENNIIIDENNDNEIKNDNSDDMNEEPMNKKIEIKINKKNKEKKEKDIKIKPILDRKNEFRFSGKFKKKAIPKVEIIDNDKDYNKNFEIINNEENQKDNIKENIDNKINSTAKGNIYIKKKLNKMPLQKENNINDNKINIKNNIDINSDYINNNYNSDEGNNHNKNIINDDTNYIGNAQNDKNNEYYIFGNKCNMYYDVNLSNENKKLAQYYSKKKNN